MIKILFLGAGPKDMDQLDMEKEARSIVESMQSGAHGGQFAPVYEKVTQVGKLQGLLLRHKPDIVHFSGHGTTDSELILLDDQGYSAPVPQAALTRLFADPELRRSVRCAVFSACYSAKQAEAVAASIDCVIGMKDYITDRSASAFAGSFYESIASGQSVATAFDRAKGQLMLLQAADADVPVLHCRPGTKPEAIFFQPPLLFCHIHASDGDLFKGMELFLQSLADDGVLRYWSIHDLSESDVIESTIEQNLQAARYILLGVSPRAVADRKWKEITERALARRKSGVKVIPLMLRPANVEGKALSTLQPFLRGKVVISYAGPPYDDAWLEVSEALRGIVTRDQE